MLLTHQNKEKCSITDSMTLALLPFNVWSFGGFKRCLVVLVVEHSFPVRLLSPRVLAPQIATWPGLSAHSNVSPQVNLTELKTKIIKVLDCTYAYNIHKKCKCSWGSYINPCTQMMREMLYLISFWRYRWFHLIQTARLCNYIQNNVNILNIHIGFRYMWVIYLFLLLCKVSFGLGGPGSLTVRKRKNISQLWQMMENMTTKNILCKPSKITAEALQ